jgi:hypothetical protein
MQHPLSIEKYEVITETGKDDRMEFRKMLEVSYVKTNTGGVKHYHGHNSRHSSCEADIPVRFARMRYAPCWLVTQAVGRGSCLKRMARE